jgi:TFIIF-interacting CTD phosphatase-like protein
MLGPQPYSLKGRKTLVLDLDETLVNSNVVESAAEQTVSKNPSKHRRN